MERGCMQLIYADAASRRLSSASTRSSASRKACALPTVPELSFVSLELIDRLALDFRRPGHGDEFEFGGSQEPCLKFHRIIHW
jgi:hypothetical protein